MDFYGFYERNIQENKEIFTDKDASSLHYISRRSVLKVKEYIYMYV